VATSRTAVRLAAAVLAASGVLGAVGTHASAEPSETTKQAQARLDKLEVEVDEAVEDFNQGRIALAKAERAAQVARGRQAAAAARLADIQRAVGVIASSAYRSAGGESMLRLMSTSGTAEVFMQRATALNHVARTNAERMRDLRSAQRELAGSRQAADRAHAAVKALNSKLAKNRSHIEAAVAEQEKLVARLTTADQKAAARRAEAAQRAAAQRLAARRRAAQERASRDNDRAADNSDDADEPDEPAIPNDVPITGRGAAAVAYAYAQIGKPYRWGADGPGAFDCSGLTMRAWGAAGVSLSHSSRAQIGEGRRVTRAQLQPGDLVFFGHPIHHVGIYIGGGQMINAPHSGQDVGIRSMARGDYAGAVRPG
jgi:cell wall-associated NlpC family hydrolase